MCAVKAVGQLSRSGMEAFHAGRVAQAEFLLHQALMRARGMQSPVLEAKILNNLGLVASLSGKREQAREMLSRALDILETRVTSGSLHAVILKNLAENHG